MTARPFQPTLTATTDDQGNCVWTQPGMAGAGDGYQCVVSIPAAVGGFFTAQIAGGVSFPPWSGSQPYGPITYQAMQTLTVTASGLLPNTTYFCVLIGFIDRIENIDWALPTSTGTTLVTASDSIINVPVLALGPLAVKTYQYFPCGSFASLRLAAVLASGGPIRVECIWWNEDVTAVMGYRRMVVGPTAPNLQTVVPHLGDMLQIVASNLATTGFSSYDDLIDTHAPILSWRFPASSAATVADRTGNGHVGTFHTDAASTYSFGITSPVVSNPADHAVTQNADIAGGAQGTYVGAPASVAWDTADMTVIQWVKPTSGSSVEHGVGGVMGGGAARWYVGINPTTGEVRIFHGGVSTLTGALIPFNTWTMLAVTFDSSDNKYRVYFNGVLQFTSGALSLGAVTNQVFAIGHNNGGGLGSQEFVGGLSDTDLFGTPLSAAQLLALYNAAIAGVATAAVLSLVATHTTQPVQMWGGLDLANGQSQLVNAGATVTMLAPPYIFGGAAILSFNPAGASAGYRMALQSQLADGSWNDFEVRTDVDGGRQLLPLFTPAAPIRLQVSNNTGAAHTMDADLMYDLHTAG